jgi:hypothetical protein
LANFHRLEYHTQRAIEGLDEKHVAVMVTRALSFYGVVRQAAHDKISGALSVFDEPKKRFVLGRRPKTKAE